MADDFERAILIGFNGAVDPQLKEQATAYINGIKQSPATAWRLCVERFSPSSYQEVKFWCLQTLHEVIRVYYGQLDANSQSTIKAALLTWLQRDFTAQQPALPPFLRNKLAQAIVALVQLEYPQAWPSFFHDLIAAAGQGQALADMFVRIMTAVDEDVISLEIPRSQDEVKLSMHLKDSMREASIGEVVEAFYNLTRAYQTDCPALAAGMLATLARYIHWIDIGLVANDKFVPLLIELMGSPSPPLRGAATDCIVEIISKRMDPVPKLSLIQRLKIAPAIAGWSNGLVPYGANGTAHGNGAVANGSRANGSAAAGGGGEDDEDAFEELMVKYVKLLAVLASEVMDALKRVENSVISLTAMGIEVDGEAAQEAGEASDAATKLLDQLLPAVLKAFRTGREEVALPLVPFLTAYVARLKMLHKRHQALPSGAQAHLQAILDGVSVNARYPDDADESLAGTGPQSEADAQAARDEQWAVEERRRELFVLLKNVAKLSFEEAVGFVGRALQGAVMRRSASFQDVEIAITLLYELGEGAPEEALKPGSGALGQLALLVMTCPGGLPAGGHRLVALASMEATVRYAKVLLQEQGAIPGVVAAFLDVRGLAHAAPDVSTRACYLFCRLSKQLRQQLRPYLSEVLSSLQPHLARVAMQPPPGDGATGTRDTSGKVGAAGSPFVDDRLYVFEAVGVLLGQEELAAEQQQAALSSLLQPLMRQIESNLPAAAAAAGQGGDASGSGAGARQGAAGLAEAAPAWLVLQAMEAISRLSKGFKPDLATRTRPNIGAMFVQCLEVAILVPKTLPTNKHLRARFIAFVHRLVELLLSTILPYLPAALEVLMHGQVDVVDMTEGLALLQQLIQRFKEALGKLLDAVLPLVITRVHALLGQDWDWSGKLASPAAMSQQHHQQQQAGSSGVAATLEGPREKGELQRAYYQLLLAVTHNGITSALLQAPPQALDAVMAALTRGAATHVDASVRRVCLQVFERLLSEWCSNGEVVPGFKRFAMEQLGGEACVLGLLRGSSGLDARDAATVALLGEVASALKLLYEKCGDDFAAHLCGRVLPSLGVPASVQQELVYHLRESDAKQLKECLRSVLVQANGGK